MLLNACCCEPGCLLFFDTFDRTNSTDLGGEWSEVSGSWSIATNVLSTPGTGLVVTTRSHNVETMSVQVTLMPSNTSITTEQLSVVVNYLDSNNYLYVRFDFVYSGVGTPTRTDMRFFRRAGGVNSQLGATRVLDASNVLLNLQAFVCYDGTYLKAMGHIEAATKIDGGLKAGLAYAGSLSTRFDNFYWYKAGPGCPSCSQDIPQLSCLDDVCTQPSLYPSDSIGVDLGAGGWTDGTCTRCNELSGDFVVTYTTQTCIRWAYVHPLWCPPASVFSPPTPGFTLSIVLTLQRTSTTTIAWICEVKITNIRNDGTPPPTESQMTSRAIYAGTVTSPNNCQTSPVTLTKTSEQHIGGACAGTFAATIEIRQLT